MRDSKQDIKRLALELDKRKTTVEIAEVDTVKWHETADDLDYNISEVVLRDRAEDDPNFKYVRKLVPTIQQRSANMSGSPINPRRGNFVKVLFYKEQSPIILGTASSKQEPPVCRPDPYTIREKFTQYQPLEQDPNDLLFKKKYADPKKPQCLNIQHGNCFGDIRDDSQPPCKGRDYYHVFDYCQQGDEEPSCENCRNIDYPQRCGNSWLKVYSTDTMSVEAPNSRYELHQKCGSFLRFENETGISKEYSEGAGHIRIENATCEAKKKGHINFNPKGSIDIHSVHEEAVIASEALGTRITVIAPEDMSVNYAVEARDFETGSYIRILKNEDIIAYSDTKIKVEAPEVTLKASTKILLDSPVTQYTGTFGPAA
jgi:hypothetical protein